MEKSIFFERVECINCASSDLEELSGGLFGDEPLRGFIMKDAWGKNPMEYIKEEKWSYVKCNNCTQTFHKYILTPEWNEVRFSEWMSQEAIAEFEKVHFSSKDQFNRAKQLVKHILSINKMIPAPNNGLPIRVLDFGCGYGDFLQMCDIFGFFSVGIDRSQARRLHGRVAVLSEIDELSELSDNFHVITLFEVLEHLDNPLSILKKLNTFLKPNGILILETPDCSDVDNIDSEISYRKIHPLDHINGFTSNTLQSIAERAGFYLVKPDISYVADNKISLAKAEIKNLMYGSIKKPTQLYFRKK